MAEPPELWWSPSQGLIVAEQRYEQKVLVRIMTPDHSRTLGGRTFPHMPVDATQMIPAAYPDTAPDESLDGVW